MIGGIGLKAKNRGVRCVLPEKGINKLLLALSQMNYECLLLNCFVINKREMILPELLNNLRVTEKFLKGMATAALFELKFLMYPTNTQRKDFDTYKDFLESDCVCCLLYYDCGWLDAYIKDPSVFASVCGLLLNLGVEQFEIITEFNDERESLRL